MRRTILLAIALIPAAGCIFRQDIRIDEYDLRSSGGTTPAAVQVTEFLNYTGGGLRMRCRNADGGVSNIPGARWVQDPGIMISRMLNRLLNSDGRKAALKVSGSIESFEYDAVSGKFLFSGFYDAGNGDIRYDIRIPAAGAEAADIAAAASEAVKTLAGRLVPVQK